MRVIASMQCASIASMLFGYAHASMSLTVHRFVLWLTALAFVCRALMPIGYMPDTSALRNGQLLLTLCTAGGGVSFLQIDASSDKKADQDISRGDTCPFGLMASQAMLMPDMPQLPAAVYARFTPVDAVFVTRPPLPPLGPPLGSRAPPYNLV